MAGGPIPQPRRECERAREWASLRVDGELSDVQAVLLDRHLAACPACVEFDARVRVTTGLLRAAPAHRPSRHVAPPARTRSFPLTRRALVAGVAAAAALGGVIGTSLDRPSSPAKSPSPAISLLPESDRDELRQLPRFQGKPAPKPVPAPNPREGLV